MILPIALVDKWPGEEYQKHHATIESALKHNVADALCLTKDVEMLKRIQKNWIPADSVCAFPGQKLETAEQVKIRHSDLQSQNRELSNCIIEKDKKLQRCIKQSDYAAMIMAAYNNSMFVAKDLFFDAADEICQRPILVRGISSGKIIKEVANRDQDFYFIETGYLGNYRCDNNLSGRKIYHRIVKNNMQHCDRIMDVPDDRYQQLVSFNPAMQYQGWKNTGSKILVVLPTDKPFQYYHDSRQKWIKYVEQTIRQHSDREIVWREKTSRSTRSNSTIYDALDDDIYCLVTYNSIAAVEAVQYGIPAFALAPTAARTVCSSDLTQIEDPIRMPEDIIYKWLCSIAYGQFNLSEMLTGRAWELVLENETRPTFNY